jgi:ribonuclease HI
MSKKDFNCRTCGKSFSVPQVALERYPGWTPSQCFTCRDAARPASAAGAKKTSSPSRPSARAGEENLRLEEVLKKYTGGPHDGLFTDGACSGNPGPGGWGAVYVCNNEVIDSAYGYDEDTTNNRMELRALIAGYKILPTDVETTIWSDSQLCVNTINDWAKKWEARGWRRKGGPIKNLELVQELYALAKASPKVELRWIKAHNGSRWNEYADSLATAYMRETL